MTHNLNLTINTGELRIVINDDPARVLVFNPTDVGFAERFYDLLTFFEARQADYEARAAALDAATDTGADGLPANLPAQLAFQREVCAAMRDQIDHLFGDGTAQTVFGDVHSIDQIVQFFEGITPFIESARAERVRRYTKPRGKGRAKVMR